MPFAPPPPYTLPSLVPARTSSRIACPPFDSAERSGVQPAAELRHVQGHNHGRNVLRKRARSARAPQPLAGPRPARRSLRASPRPPASARAPASQPAPRSASHALQRHDHMYGMFYVRSSPCPAPNLQSSPPPCTLRAPRSPSFHLSPPGLQLAPHHVPSFRLSAVRDGVQSAAELRHVQRREHVQHVLRALRPWALAPSLPMPLALPPLHTPPACRPTPRPASYVPSFRLDRVISSLGPTPTNCSPVARLRATRNSSVGIYTVGVLWKAAQVAEMA